MGQIQDTNIIREVTVRYRGPRRKAPCTIHEPGQVAAYLRRRIDDDAREHLIAIYLDGRNRPIADRIVSIGTANASLVHPREVFQPAIALGACSLILGHNHPSGDVVPSREDHEVTKRISEAGILLGVRLMDHLVWEREGNFTSMRTDFPSLFLTKDA